MEFTCPACSHGFTIPESELADRDIPVMCPHCSTACSVDSGRTLTPVASPPRRRNSGMDDDELAQWLARRRARARRKVWVLAGDPAIDRPGVAAVLDQMCPNCHLEMLDGHTRSQRAAEASLLDSLPDVLLFGDLHVILQDELLSKLARVSDVTRVLLSTHHNDDLVGAAREFCTVDKHVVLPESEGESALATHLSEATGVPAALPV